MGAGQSKPASSSPSLIPATSILTDTSSAASNATAIDASTKDANSSSGGCPMKNSDGSYRTMPGFGSLFSRHPPVPEKVMESAANDSLKESNETNTNSSSSGCPVQGPSRSKAISLFSRSGPSPDSTTVDATRQQYDVYSRPLEVDPSNNMPLSNPDNLARNSLPSKEQKIPLPTERVSSTIPKGGADGETTWTYPSPQMFWNSLARKGKLGDTKEEDMETVVAIHNNMNEGTWAKVLEWEDVIGEGTPKLSKFTGRPFDLSPKATIKHYLLGHPFPFDRHDWTVLRPSGQQVRYVIDYYHDTAAENDDTSIEDLQIGRGGKCNSLLVDVRPALDGPSELWGRMVSMPLAIRGCASIVDCVLGGGEGTEKKSEFEPLPLLPSDTLKLSMDDSKEVWANIQKDSKQKIEDDNKAVTVATDVSVVTEAEAMQIADTYATILKQCENVKVQLQNCGSDAECRKAFMGMTACAGKVMCPLQHKSFADTIKQVSAGTDIDEKTSAKINIAFDTLSECVANNDSKASVAREQHPEVFQNIVGQ